MLKQINYDTCPCCGAVATEWRREADHNKKKYREHAHGGLWETVRFACGRTDEASPSPVRINTKIKCPNEPEIAEQVAARVQALQSMFTHLDTLEVDAQFKRRMADALHMLNPRLFR